MDARRLTAELRGTWTESKREGMARCPGHRDVDPSLSIKAGSNGTPLLHCFGGCSYQRVANAIKARGIRLRTASQQRSEDDERERRIAKVTKIIRHTVSLTGTPGRRYLRRRGITADLKRMPIRFQASAQMGEGIGAVVFIGEDADGSDQFTQRVYITEEGKKADIDPQKRTNGPLAGAAVKFSGDHKDGIIVAEGPETALSIWQATGRETWACCGIGALAKVPLPEGVPVVIARDVHAADHASTTALHEAAAALFERGHDVSIASPPEPNHEDGYDFNDTLRRKLSRHGGELAIRRAIKAAERFVPPSHAPEPARAPWPKLDEAAALFGLAGEVVRAIDPHTEADKVATLLSFLTAYGNVIGRGAHCRVTRDMHHTNLFVLLVGRTARSRKGLSWAPVRDMFASIDPEWVENQIASGLSTGEGLIHRVRDPEPDEDGDGPRKAGDKRLLVHEAEFSVVLRRDEREGSSLSPIIRCLWDGSTLETLTKSDPMKARGVHGSILAHITAEELRRGLKRVEAASGFGNRFLIACVRRSGRLPFGGDLTDELLGRLARKVKKAVENVHEGQFTFDSAAARRWEEIYTSMSGGDIGLAGSLTARAEAQMLRLALVYAALDGTTRIHLEHLTAAHAVWEYCEASVRYLFGASTGDPVADRVLEDLREAGAKGLAKNDLSERFGQHPDQIRRLNEALDLLVTSRLVREKRIKTGKVGRPATIYRIREGK